MSRRAQMRLPGAGIAATLVTLPVTVLVAMLAAMLAASGCATQTAAPPGQQADGALLESRITPGATTRAQLLAWFGATSQVRFDSGYEAWVYQVPAGSGQFSEFVILIDPQGTVSKIRRRPAEAPPTPAR